MFIISKRNSMVLVLKDQTGRLIKILKKYSRFVGPGLMVSVAYMDPGNYSTAVAAGSAYKYNLLFSILLSNCLAIFLQILSSKLGAVTGLDLAANCRANLSSNVNFIVYLLAELAIIATDLAEVIGTAISLNILFNLPLVVGVILTVIDVLIVLMAYRPNGPLLFVRIFESFVSLLVAATVICFIVELGQVSHDPSINFSITEVFKGFLPNESVVDMSEKEGGNGLFLSLAILGATVMPHSLYLGSGLVQARLKDFDMKHGYYNPSAKRIAVEADNNQEELATDANDLSVEVSPQIQVEKEENEDDMYRPSIHAINDTMTYTLVELVISLFTVALFVNSAILIVAGATLSGNSNRIRDDGYESDDSDDDLENADLFTIYNLLSTHLSPTAGLLFALALLFSGQSAGVVCTLAGQMVSEGFLHWSLPPVTRRLITRGLAIIPCLVVASFAGREGLAKILNSSQVVLSVLLPFVSAPLIWFTCSKEIMKVPVFLKDGVEDSDSNYNFEDQPTSFTESVTSGKSIRYKSTEPAIRLQDLRNSHPCAGWDNDEFEEGEEQQGLIAHSQPFAAIGSHHQRQYSSQDRPSNNTGIPPTGPTDNYKIKGYQDMSNGPITSFIAIVVWGFITCLNIYLIGSWLLGYDVPF